jgi:hypothetical protein
MKWKPYQVNILAAVFARSNMGQLRPSAAELARVVRSGREKNTLHGCVIMLCEQYMETNDHEEMFLDEAGGWARTLSRESVETTRRKHKDIVELYEEAERLCG